ncbi:uncharacterized protein LOC132742414 [Ruditapes philippinarum]|uniref:uncharacterized protein LOC132742414 n=1 Tax=Ruditapes philippinarum TaxID=129788 RepID=UPI00295BDA3B|nr:uncharacterized protein LOC132742414 [Ruditapes philippinarum]
MEQFALNDDDFETTAVKIELPRQVMIEKWKLVLLIVGCSSFMFIIYFPIDFFLYRRRKRLARERQKQSACRSSPVRAAQCHAHVTPPNVSAETEYNEIDEIEQRKLRAQRGVIRFLNMLRMKKSNAEMLGNRDTVPSDKSVSPRVNIIPDPETVTSTNGSAHFLSDFEGSSIQKSNYSLYDDDYLDYTPEKKISNTAKNLNENQDVYSINMRKSHLGVQFDKKMSKFTAEKINRGSPPNTSRGKKKTGLSAMGPLENATDFFSESDYFISPVPSRNESMIYIGENDKDIVNINKVHQEVISDTNNLSSAGNIFDNESNAPTSNSVRNSEVKTDDSSENTRDNTALMFQTDSDKDRKSFVRHKKLNHSQSDMCMVSKPNFSKLSHKNGRKRNVILPVCSDTFTEQMNYMHTESSSSDKSLPISIPIFAEYSGTPKIKRKKKKKSILRKKGSDSMPDLFYDTESFSCANE